MHPNAILIERLYTSLRNGDADSAADCYTSDAYFEDIAFRLQGRDQIRDMWRIVCRADVKVTDIHADFADDEIGRGRWVADYMFDKIEHPPGRPVISRINSEFGFRDGAIHRHVDRVDPMVWAKQAYPFPWNIAIGRLGFLRRHGARKKLRKFRDEQQAASRSQA